MSIDLYYIESKNIFYITNVEAKQENAIRIRSICSGNHNKLLLVYLFLLAKYSIGKIHYYKPIKNYRFLEKFDSITRKYGQLAPEYFKTDLNFSGAEKDRISLFSSTKSLELSVYNDITIFEPEIPCLNVSNTDLKYLLLEAKKSQYTKDIIHSLTTFWHGTIMYSTNYLLSGLFPVFKTETEIVFGDIKFPTTMINGKLVILGSFIQYFPLFVDKVGIPCSVTGITSNGSSLVPPFRKISNTDDILDTSTVSTMIEYLIATKETAIPELRSILDYLISSS